MAFVRVVRRGVHAVVQADVSGDEIVGGGVVQQGVLLGQSRVQPVQKRAQLFKFFRTAA